MLKGIYILDPGAFRDIYGDAEREDIGRLVDIYAPQQTRETIAKSPLILRDAEIIFSGWGAPLMDENFLAAVPRLKAVFYGAGSLKGVVTDAFWKRGALITSAYAANAVPVAEYTLSQILFCLKCGWQFVQAIKRDGKYTRGITAHGAYGSIVGIISLGATGRRVCQMLKMFDLKVLAYDPHVSPQVAAELNVALCSLEEIFRRADVVSLHTPWLPETEGMIAGIHFASMKSNAAFINTARGAVVREDEMVKALQQRPDIQAVLDVTYPEPPPAGSPLYTLPNVILTPHIAGSMGNECRRMGRYMADELRRYLNGEPLHWTISRQQAEIMA